MEQAACQQQAACLVARCLLKKASSIFGEQQFAAEAQIKNFKKGKPMLYTIAVVLIVLWLLGIVTSYTVGGFIHILIVVAIIMVLVRLISGRAP